MYWIYYYYYFYFIEDFYVRINFIVIIFMSEQGNEQDISRDLGASESKGGETELKQSHIQGNGEEQILDKLEERIREI